MVNLADISRVRVKEDRNEVSKAGEAVGDGDESLRRSRFYTAQKSGNGILIRWSTFVFVFRWNENLTGGLAFEPHDHLRHARRQKVCRADGLVIPPMATPPILACTFSVRPRSQLHRNISWPCLQCRPVQSDIGMFVRHEQM